MAGILCAAAKAMSPEEHKERHKILHRHFDELFADYIDHHPKQVRFLEMPVRLLLDWSYEQTKNPTRKS